MIRILRTRTQPLASCICYTNIFVAGICYTNIFVAGGDVNVQVQQEYHELFETSNVDPAAVLRWRNRALRFVLNPDASASTQSNTDTAAIGWQTVGKAAWAINQSANSKHRFCLCLQPKASYHTSFSLGELSVASVDA